MKSSVVLGVDASDIFTVLGGERKVNNSIPTSTVVEQARIIIDKAPDFFKLAVFKAELSDDGVFLRVVERIFSAVDEGGTYRAIPSTNNNQQFWTKH